MKEEKKKKLVVQLSLSPFWPCCHADLCLLADSENLFRTRLIVERSRTQSHDTYYLADCVEYQQCGELYFCIGFGPGMQLDRQSAERNNEYSIKEQKRPD